VGVQRGTNLDLTLTGTNLGDPTGVWTSFPAKVTIPTEGNNGKDQTKLLVKIEVPKDAPLGLHSLRLATTRGMSNVRLFCIDDLPQVMETATNHTIEMAQVVPVPCVVCGRADAEQRDYFKVSVKAGEALSFEVLGRRLGSAFDPQITLYDAKTGREVPGAHSNDAPGLQTDAALRWTFKDAGDYVIEIRDVTWKGGEDFLYRLRIGDFPLAATTIPMAVKRGSKATVHFGGSWVDKVAPVEVQAPADPNAEVVWVTPKGASGLPGWPVAVAMSDLDETVEQEPNNEQAKANRVPVPGAVTGRFEQKGDVDWFVFTAKKGQRLILEAHTQDYNSPTELLLTLKDAKGAVVQATNPANPPRLDFTPMVDGDFYLTAEHLHGWGGPAEVYRLTVVPYEPGFDLSVQLDRFDAPQAGGLVIPILMTRRDYTGPVDISVRGPAGITGKLNIPMGKVAPPGQPIGALLVNASGEQPMGPVIFEIVGTATINGKLVTEYASVRTAVSTSLAALPVPPRTTWRSIALAVTERAPFTLTAKFDEASGMPGKPVNLTVTVTRVAGFAGDITLAVGNLPPNVTTMPKPIPGAMNEVKLPVNLAANAAVGDYPIIVTGKAKHQMKDFTVTAAPVMLVIKK
jgi:hypothetical protein